MEEEIKMIEKSETWKIVDCPKDRNHWRQMGAQDKTNCKWVNSEA